MYLYRYSSIYIHFVCWRNGNRTGRVRPGTVYRLYSRKMGKEVMQDQDEAEMRRLPLDWVVLELKDMMAGDAVLPALEVGLRYARCFSLVVFLLLLVVALLLLLCFL